MLYREFTSTGDKISIIGFGGIVVKDESSSDVSKYVEYAYENGVNYFDVAPAYGNAEQNLGPALAPYRKNVFLACKTGKRTYHDAEREFKNSLSNMKTDYFDLYQMHSVSTEEDFQNIIKKDGVLNFLIEMKDKGHIRNIGFSAHSSKIGVKLLDYFDFDSVLFPLNFTSWYQGGFGHDLLSKAIETNTTRLGLKPGASNALSKSTINCKPSKDILRVRKKCWYAPIEDYEIMKIAYKWALSQSITSVLPPGEFDLWEKALKVINEYKPIEDHEIQKLIDFSENKLPLFTA